AKGEVAVFPSTHVFQLLMQSLVDSFTRNGGKVPNGNDFTGFIPDKGSSTKGWLSVNHENSPGGVSILDIHYDETTGLWVVDSISPVDFGGIVQTVRNCSGGITPWGTIITSEETYNAGDVNGDGYTDVGWNVEIDPKTRKIKDYNGDGKPDKLWALGRMSHENVAVSDDGITVYQGEDGGTNCVYKFVADKQNDLSTGKLYVLKRDNATATTGTWILVPNTTQTERNTSRDLAGALGGTAWNGVEDVEIGPDGMVYFTAKGLGHVWRFKDEGGTISNLEIFVQGNAIFSIAHEGGDIQEPYRTGNDNLAFDNEGNLWILQDGGQDHIWLARKGHTMANPMIEVFNTSPLGSEPTGMTFTPDYRFMFISYQNPSSSNKKVAQDVAGKTFVYNSSATMVIARKEFLGTVATVKPFVNLGNDTTICEGQSLTLKADAINGVALWNDNSTDSIMEVDEAGKYYVTVIGNNGLETSDTINVMISTLPTPFIGNDTFICASCQLILDAGFGTSYKWSTGATTRTIIATQPGRYTVIVKNTDGCGASDEINIYGLPSAISEINGEGFSLFAYPNPFQLEAKVKLSLTAATEVKVVVYDLNGKQIIVLVNGPMVAGEHVLRFNPADYGDASQMYFVRMEINAQSYTLRLIKQ
ncbi:MAG: DUF839 domain-containing protein, partial [Bacteroidota bacterium]|nr:DUF839 domain-containing protein [Bacteroidota bacterium]